MQVVDSIADLRRVRKTLKGTVGLVPTMGALHAGHLSLVNAAREDNDALIATIFVNPTQFAPDEDLQSYPRDLPNDLSRLEQAGVDVVFTPTPTIMYPHGFQTTITVEHVTKGLEGSHRPGHFQGVTTVVAKLFNLAQPDRAYFGQKDAQQVVVLRRMVADLNFSLDIVVCPTTREADGLAMSSRNAYLTAQERQAATVLNRALSLAGEAYTNGERDPEALRTIIRDTISQEPLANVDYISIADAKTLEEAHHSSESPLLLSLTVQIGKPRLLDNRVLPLALNTRDGLTKTLGFVS